MPESQGFAEALREASTVPKRETRKLFLAAAAMNEQDRRELLTACADPDIANSWIATALTAVGWPIDGTSVRRTRQQLLDHYEQLQ